MLRGETVISSPPSSEQMQATEVKMIRDEHKVVTKPRPTMYLVIFGSWLAAVLWFGPRLLTLFDMADSWLGFAAIFFFIFFVGVAWLYGFFNAGVVLFAAIYRRFFATAPPGPQPGYSEPAVALLYTTCNDFLEESVESCINQDYDAYTVYILDDSSSLEYQARIDRFAAQHPQIVKVVRRENRVSYKAGNMNHGLSNIAVNEPYFAIADADEILPPDFLRKIVPILEADSEVGFVQANHRANPTATSPLSQSLGSGIDSHWRWYQPLRNRYGFVMFLGHGAVLRRECWEAIGGFPDIVSEDLGFAIRARELGWRGYFAEHVVCYEDFPDTVRAFRVRHIKWTRGTCEFLSKESPALLKSRNITWAEKFDILFPTLNLPLTLFYFLFMLDANLLFPYLFGVKRDVTLAVGGQDFVFPVWALSEGFNAIYSADFFVITVLTFIAPVLCFLLDMWRKPLQLFRFLSHSTAVYAALGPLSTVGVLSYLITGKATFLVTGDNTGIPANGQQKQSLWHKVKSEFQLVLNRSHPDQLSIQAFEIACGVGFGIICIFLFQVSFLGLAFAFAFLPVLHHINWLNPVVQLLLYVPFVLVILGITLGGMALLGLPTMFFAFGFHF